jgi:anti-anti-sigma factor
MAETIRVADRSPLTLDRPYSSDWEPEFRVLRVHGVIDELSAHAFRGDLLACLEAGDTMTVDLSDVDLFPSVAVGALVAGIKRAAANGSTLEVLVVAGSVPQRVLAICRLPHRLA